MSRPQKIENPKTAVGKLIEFNFKSAKGRNAVFSYNANGVRYKLVAHDLTGNNIGDKYLIEYNEEQPEKANLLRYEPIFEKEDKMERTFWEVLNISKVLSEIEFKYDVNGYTFFSRQNIKLTSDLKKVLKGNKKFEVAYLVNRESRAILYLNRPLE